MLCRVLAVGATLLKHASVFVSSHAGCQSCCRVKEQERLDVTRVKPTVWWREQRLRLYWRSTAANSPQERNKMTTDRHWCSDSVYTEHVHHAVTRRNQTVLLQSTEKSALEAHNTLQPIMMHLQLIEAPFLFLMHHITYLFFRFI